MGDGKIVSAEDDSDRGIRFLSRNVRKRIGAMRKGNTQAPDRSKWTRHGLDHLIHKTKTPITEAARALSA